VIPGSGWRTIRSELTAASTPDQVHAYQMMTEVHTVSIVAKNKYSGRAGVRAPTRGGTKVRKPFTRVKIAPAMIFASRFALNGSSRHATIMAMGISIKTAEPSRAHGGRRGNRSSGFALLHRRKLRTASEEAALFGDGLNIKKPIQTFMVDCLAIFSFFIH
jgi:hypothetical protein